VGDYKKSVWSHFEEETGSVELQKGRESDISRGGESCFRKEVK